MELTERDEQDDLVVDVEHGPEEADEGERARRAHVGEHELPLEPVADKRRDDVRDALHEGQESQREGRLLRRDILQLHVVRLHKWNTCQARTKKNLVGSDAT